MISAFRIVGLVLLLVSPLTCLAADIPFAASSGSALATGSVLLRPVGARLGMEVAGIGALIAVAAGQLRFGGPSSRKPRRG